MYSVGYVMYGISEVNIKSCVDTWMKECSSEEIKEYWNKK